MNQSEFYARARYQIIQLINFEMEGEKWYPKPLPRKQDGSPDFTQIEVLWQQEVERRHAEYVSLGLIEITPECDIIFHDVNPNVSVERVNSVSR